MATKNAPKGDLASLGDKIASLKVVKAVELRDYLKEVYKIAPALKTHNVTLAGDAQDADTEFTVVLEGFDPAKKIQVIKVAREITGLGLKQAKDLVEGAPKPIRENVAKTDAERVKRHLEAAGARVSLKSMDARDKEVRQPVVPVREARKADETSVEKLAQALGGFFTFAQSRGVSASEAKKVVAEMVSLLPLGDSSEAAAAPAAIVLERFTGFVDQVDGDIAYVTLTSEHGDALLGEYPARDLQKLGIEERRRFQCLTTKTGDKVDVELMPISERTLTEQEENEIRARIDQCFGDSQLDDDA